MPASSRLWIGSAVGTGLLAAALLTAPATAQFGTSTAFPGLVRLPDNDFVWTWGDFERAQGRRGRDFDVKGGEQAFRCELTGRLRLSSGMDRDDIRNMERSLATSLVFIQAAAEAMTILDRQFEVDWASLDCKKSDQELTAEQAQEREDKALERAVRERERRREREDD